jgi:hypothetical protein
MYKVESEIGQNPRYRRPPSWKKITSWLPYLLADRVQILSVGQHSLGKCSLRRKVKLAKIQDDGGRHLDIQIYSITTVFIGRSYSNLSVALYSLRDSSMGFKMGFVKRWRWPPSWKSKYIITIRIYLAVRLQILSLSRIYSRESHIEPLDLKHEHERSHPPTNALHIWES